MHNYSELKIWQKGIELTEVMYKVLADFPDNEKFGIVSQLRRAVVSVPSNIAEGASRESKKDFNRFLSISLGSLFEVDTQLIISKNVNYLNEKDYKELNNKVKELIRMMISFKKKIKEDTNR